MQYIHLFLFQSFVICFRKTYAHSKCLKKAQHLCVHIHLATGHYRGNTVSNCSMAVQLNWDELLKERFPTYKSEEEAYLNSLNIANSSDVYCEQIYAAIISDTNVPDTLKALYKEAIRGTNKDVVKRIRNRIGNIRRNCRLVLMCLSSKAILKMQTYMHFILKNCCRCNPKIRALDMLHAANFTHMSLVNLQDRVKEAKNQR